MKSEKSDKRAKPVAPAAKPAGKVFDVRRPGKALAPPTSRPVIAGHKPLAPGSQAAVSGVGEGSSLLSHKPKIQIKPLTPDSADAPEPSTPAVAEQSTKAKAAEAEEALATTALAATAEATIEEPAKPAAKPSEPSTPALPPIPEPSPVSPSAAPEPAEPASKPTAPPEPAVPQTSIPEQPAPNEPIAPSPESEPAFEDLIVVSQHHGKSTAAWEIVLLTVLALAFAAAAINVLLDLAILDWPLPHTNFFSES